MPRVYRRLQMYCSLQSRQTKQSNDRCISEFCPILHGAQQRFSLFRMTYDRPVQSVGSH